MGAPEGLEKGVAPGVWLFKWGTLQFLFTMRRVFIFYVDMG